MEEICSVETVDTGSPSGNLSPPSPPPLHISLSLSLSDFTSQQLTDRIEYAGIDHMEEICSVETVDTGSPSGNLSPPSPPPLHISLSLSKISRASCYQIV